MARSVPAATGSGRERQIIHCDCDCFYASIEMRDNPSLTAKPLAVGGAPNRRGVIATCNYEARRYGIHSAMSAAAARRRCPDLIILRPAMDKYREASREIHRVFARYTAVIEPLSLDEAYLDVTDCAAFGGNAADMATAIRDEVRERVGITLSAGIAPNKFLAKIASDWHKPDGQFLIEPAAVAAFVAALPVAKLHGVGKVTAARMGKLGITVCADLAGLSAAELARHFGSFGERLRQLSHGLDERPVEPRRIRKSVSVENTFADDLPDVERCLAALPQLEAQLSARWAEVSADYAIHKQFVKIKFRDFVTTTVEMPSVAADPGNYRHLLRDGFQRGGKPVRLLGIGVRVRPRGGGAAGEEAVQHSLLP